MPKPICIVNDCTKKRHAAGYCNMHYKRTKKHGHPGSPLPREVHQRCVVDNCMKKRYGGVRYCPMHNYRIKKYGDPHTARKRGTGDDVTVSGVHRRLYRKRGPAKNHQCVDCGRQARHWSYDHRDPNEKRCLIHGPYSPNIDRYAPRCVPCHKRFDLAHLGGRLRNLHRTGSFR